MTYRLPVAFALVSVFVAAGTYASSTNPPSALVATEVTAFGHKLPNVPGKSLTGILVTYKPGESTPPHRHDSAFVVAYVLSGAVRSQLEGGQLKVYHAGESFSENPGAHHIVSANASKTEPATFLAIFVSDSKDPAPVEMDKH